MKSTLVILLFGLALVPSSIAFISSPIGIFTSGFRSLAEAKLATAGKIVSYITGDRPVQASVALAVGDKPEEVQAVEAVQPAVETQVEAVPVQTQTSSSQWPPADLDAALYAIKLDEQLHKSELQFQPPQGAIPLNAQEFQDMVPAGNTGGRLVGVSMIPQTQYQQYQPWQLSRGELKTHYPVSTENNGPQYGITSGMYQWNIPQKGWEQSMTESAKASSNVPQGPTHVVDPTALLQTPSVAAGQAVIYPYGPVKIPAYPGGSYMIHPVPVETANPASNQASAPQGHSYVLQAGDEPTIPGSRLPEMTFDPLTAPSEKRAVEVPSPNEDFLSQESSVVVSTSVPEGNETTANETVNSRKARSVTEEKIEPGRRVELSAEDVESYFRFIQKYDESQCMARLICEVAHNPQEFGMYGRQIDHFFREYEPVKSQAASIYYKTASERGRSSDDVAECGVKYKACALDSTQLRKLAPVEA